jgi:AbrB family looped-hinge helix DNA binding protein
MPTVVPLEPSPAAYPFCGFGAPYGFTHFVRLPHPQPNAIDNWFLPPHNPIMATKLTLDKAGRVVLPKPLRDRLQLAPGDTLHLESEGESITLRPVRQNVMLKKELGVWVYQGESTDASIVDLIDRDRENRLRSVSE